MRRVGETITINAQLVSTETGAHVWADRFEGERSKLGELQVEAVGRIANALGDTTRKCRGVALASRAAERIRTPSILRCAGWRN